MSLRDFIGFFAESGTATPWLALLATYLVHSLIWSGATLLLVRHQSLSWSTRHLFWKAALFAPLSSAVLACVATGSIAHAAQRASAFVQPLLVTQSTRSGEHGWALPLDLFCSGAALLGLLRFAILVYRVRTRLSQRRPLGDRRILARMEQLCRQLGLDSIVLSESSGNANASPLVIGLAEVCLPAGLLGELTDAELDCVLAHELAHIERRDGLWFPVAGALQSVLWLNPLNYWICRRFRASAEFACDDRALELTGNRLGLARALVHVATTAAFAQRLSMLPSIVHSKAVLLPRVRRLLEAPLASAQIGRCERLWSLVVVGALLAMLCPLGMRVARAQPTLARGAARSAASAVEEQSSQMAELAQRERRVAALLAAAEPLSDATPEGTTETARVLELSQELRHIHATQLWLEERFASTP